MGTEDGKDFAVRLPCESISTASTGCSRPRIEDNAQAKVVLDTPPLAKATEIIVGISSFLSAVIRAQGAYAWRVENFAWG